MLRYIERQEGEVSSCGILKTKKIPEWLDYGSIPSLRTEARQKLIQNPPRYAGSSLSDFPVYLLPMSVL